MKLTCEDIKKYGTVEEKNTATTEAAMSLLIEQRACLIIVSFRDLNGSCRADFQLTLGIVYQHVNLCCA